ncbi:MAG: penicillin-binding protein activator [Burkholderiaceae bacterium]|nr:penicillin-binding protein activator [Burkholderiaceae bacterium]MEB2351742.1 penicillin-binding protein activator [Burkholderiaceae bacterium]
MPLRRKVLSALAGTVLVAVPALSALAQSPTSTRGAGNRGSGDPASRSISDPASRGTSDPGSRGAIGPESRGVASTERQLLGKGPIGVALLVPPDNGIYRRAAQALIAGVRAAHARDGARVTLEIIEIDEDAAKLRALYDELAQRGFSMVIGPLARSAVDLVAAAGPPPVFTLALNQPDKGAVPANMVTFGLSIESEARQAASIAWEEATIANASRRPRAAAVQDASPLGARAAAAFAARWRELGGDVYQPVTIDTVTTGRVRTAVARLQADVYFVAAPPAAARALLIALGTRATIYATSLTNTGAVAGSEATALVRSPDLDGVRLVEMPWQVQPDHPVVMAYPKPAEMHLELQKLYALGIDAFRLALQLLERGPEVELDGVTGRLRLSALGGRAVERTGVLAEYRAGVLVPLTLQ